MSSISLFVYLLLLIFSFPAHASIEPRRPLGLSAVFSRVSSNSPSSSSRTASSSIHGDLKKKIDGSLINVPRGGQDIDGLVHVLGTITQTLISCGRAVLPPSVAFIKGIVKFYRALPVDAVVAQVGLVYCFAGGYYPTLFSSLQAAQLCGWNVMVEAIDDLSKEAIKVIDSTMELAEEEVNLDRKKKFIRQTNIVLKTVDPMKINQAATALYSTWLGVSVVIEKEYARVICLSMTMAGYFQRIAYFIFEPPARMCISEDYHRWVPVVIGWICKASAMNIAWRIQRVLTASTSAMAGGLMFSGALLRMLSKRGVRLFGLIVQQDEDEEESPTSVESPLEDIIGFMVAGLGFYTQIEYQYRNGFTFEVPFPINLITWPFDVAEKWIQWQITK